MINNKFFEVRFQLVNGSVWKSTLPANYSGEPENTRKALEGSISYALFIRTNQGKRFDIFEAPNLPTAAAAYPNAKAIDIGLVYGLVDLMNSADRELSHLEGAEREERKTAAQQAIAAYARGEWEFIHASAVIFSLGEGADWE